MAHSDWNKTYHVDEMTLSPYSSTKDLLINTPGVGWAVRFELRRFLLYNTVCVQEEVPLLLRLC